MRKILAGFMATAMVTSICATASMAANVTTPSVTFTATDKVDATLTPTVTGSPTAISGNATFDVTTTAIEINLRNSSSQILETLTIPMVKSYSDKTSAASGTNALAAVNDIVPVADILAAVKDYKFSASIDNKIYSGRIAVSGNEFKLLFDGSAVVELASADYEVLATASAVDTSGITFTAGTNPAITATVALSDATDTQAVVKGTAPEASDVTTSGTFFNNLSIKDVILCDGNGNPVPMTDKDVGADKALNDQGGVQSSKTLYFMVRDDVITTFADDTFWKLKTSKGDNGKMIKAISDTTKIFSGGLFDANSGKKVDVSGIDFGKRHRYVKVELNEIFTDDEYKISLDMRLTPTSKAESKYAGQGVDGSEIKINDFSFWMKNIVKSADNDWKVGINGLMLDPLPNDWNNVTYYDEDGDVAFVKFFGDSDVGKFYSKLSTKWAHEDYAAYFNDQDAFYFEFTGSPKLSSTSRADLQIYNPFVDEDGNETIDPSTATIYQVVDGDLIDVTESFTYGEGENGEDAFITRTRFLGSYIICEKPVEEATGDADIDDLMPDENETPEEVTPDNNGGGKAPANTGRYL